MIIASIDIGTNTVLLLIAEADRSIQQIKTVRNFYEIPRIGKGLLQGEEIREENIQRLISTLKNYKRIINDFNCEKILITGTKALRTAKNSNAITDRIKDELDFEINIITGEEEAELSFLGAVFENQDKNNLVIDIGGGSTEIIYGQINKIEFKRSFDAGVVSLTEKYFKHDPPLLEELLDLKKNIIQNLQELEKLNLTAYESIAIAGTPTTLTCMKMNLKEYDEDKIEGSILYLNEINKLIELLVPLSSEEIKSTYASIVEGREDLILAGSILLASIMELLGIHKVKVSSKGIRYGAIVKYILWK